MTLVKFNHRPTFRTNFPGFETFLNDDLFRNWFGDQSTSSPAVNVVEHANGFSLEIAAPGLAKEDFKLSLDKDTLSINVAKESTSEENQPNYRRREFNYTQWERSFKLPKTVDQANVGARYENGILHVNLPKLPEAQDKGVREITIS